MARLHWIWLVLVFAGLVASALGDEGVSIVLMAAALIAGLVARRRTGTTL